MTLGLFAVYWIALTLFANLYEHTYNTRGYRAKGRPLPLGRLKEEFGEKLTVLREAEKEARAKAEAEVLPASRTTCPTCMDCFVRL
eukprot:SAG11_NODE_1002_length_6214_cov_2.976124_3_plen_86_part_00